ncbi:MAG: hypothetical protein BZY79_05325 [SAR202 cluster bacterium Casp-Chloro-G4]|nr:hypothetical protein [Chloroflexota bacterium]MDA1227293.1 hypothetical protein [Chloroflexota bacterium]PKB61170.1 MAG: hypothetical protein BZY79_05325 [SAR202 cluster bacterium Casp-Chloro-G4]
MKPFQVLLIGAAVWGITLALAFVGGIAVGNSGDDNAMAGQTAGISGDQAAFDPADREALRQRIQSGEATQEEIDQLRQRFQQGGGQGGQFRGPGGANPGATPPPN